MMVVSCSLQPKDVAESRKHSGWYMLLAFFDVIGQSNDVDDGNDGDGDGGAW